ncbi:MAG: adenylate/guanylate cyclase domain-containing protein, partial [Acidimicrobiia bacterium]
MNCPACGTRAPVEARFCPTCGHALVNRPDERRIATLVFADLVGFTSMSQDADPEHVKRIVDTCFEALAVDVTAYGGRVDKIVGDELIAIFGAPVTHEDDAERAVRCALQMQRTLATLGDRLGAQVEMRVGVNTGEVVVGALRGGGDPTAMGDAVNVASRLQSAAAPGHVLVGPLTQAATLDAISYEDLGSLAVKGRDEPVAAWRALATLMPPGRRKRERTPIVGRDAELAMLRGIIDGASQRSRAHLVLVTADAGVGKSRLVGELVRESQAERDAFVVRSHCVPYGEDAAWPIAEMIRDACAFDSEASVEEARTAITAKIATLTSRPLDDPGVERDTRGLLFLVGHAEELHDVDPTRARDDAFRAVGQLLKALAREHLVIFTCADLQWADEIVLELLERLMEGLRSQPIVVFATTRPELLDSWQPKPGRHDQTVLNLDPLDEESV